MADETVFKPGLEGVVAFETEIAEPDKEGSALRYRGVDIEDLVGRVSYGNVWGLLVDGTCFLTSTTSRGVTSWPAARSLQCRSSRSPRVGSASRWCRKSASTNA